MYFINASLLHLCTKFYYANIIIIIIILYSLLTFNVVITYLSNTMTLMYERDKIYHSDIFKNIAKRHIHNINLTNIF